jgi:type II secretory pathway component PulK
MNNKGTAIIITLVYLFIVTIICAAVLGFSLRHYRLTSQRVERAMNLYYAEAGIYAGLAGVTGDIKVFPDVTDPLDQRYGVVKVTINDNDPNPDDLESRREWEAYKP